MPLILSIAAFRVPCFAGFYAGETTGLDPVKASLTVLETCATPSKWARDPLQRSAAKTEIPSDFKQEVFQSRIVFYSWLFIQISSNLGRYLEVAEEETTYSSAKSTVSGIFGAVPCFWLHKGQTLPMKCVPFTLGVWWHCAATLCKP